VEAVLDPNRSSKALAGVTRIRVRGSALFSPLDKDHLLNHEASVQTAIPLNGHKQTNLLFFLGFQPAQTDRYDSLLCP
jgi:hypothetical protein